MSCASSLPYQAREDGNRPTQRTVMSDFGPHSKFSHHCSVYEPRSQITIQVTVVRVETMRPVKPGVIRSKHEPSHYTRASIFPGCRYLLWRRGFRPCGGAISPNGLGHVLACTVAICVLGAKLVNSAARVAALAADQEDQPSRGRSYPPAGRDRAEARK